MRHFSKMRCSGSGEFDESGPFKVTAQHNNDRTESGHNRAAIFAVEGTIARFRAHAAKRLIRCHAAWTLIDLIGELLESGALRSGLKERNRNPLAFPAVCAGQALPVRLLADSSHRFARHHADL